MGQRTSLFKSTKKQTNMACPLEKVNKKYPLLVEVRMLRQIKEQYNMHLKPNTNEVHELSEFFGRVIDKDDLKKLIIPYKTSEGLARGEKPTPILLEEYIIDQVVNKVREQREADIREREKNYAGIKITDLPNLVIQNLLDFLNPYDILSLRATCTQTKAWIDTNFYILSDFIIRIENEACNYNELPPYASPWSNFAIPYVRLRSSFIFNTIWNNRDQIWRLEIYAPKCISSFSTNYPATHPHRLFQIINRCPWIQHLSICRIDTLTELGELQYPLLRVLSIDRIEWMKDSDFEIFSDLIMKCPNLEYLKMPEYDILGSLAYIFYDVDASPEKEHLIRPVIKYMDKYRSDKCRPRRSKLYIDVLEFEDFKLCSSDIFYELSRKCIECNAVLMNVYFVPRDAVFRNQQNIVESFASMFGFIKIDFEAELWKHLEVMECWIEDFPGDFELTMRQLSFLTTISKIQTLRSLTIRLSVENPYICSATLEACVGQEYSAIQKLILRRHQVNPDNHVRIPEGFGTAFSNVKYLYFQELDSTNEDFRNLWPDMPNLEELFVYKCPYFTQEAFIRPTSINDENDNYDERDQPVLKLKKLQILVIFLQDGICGFNDEFILKALRFMRLKGFALRGAAGVEFTETGMLSLLGSPFHETIEDFEAPSACFRANLSSNYWNFYVALPKKELRKNRVWLSCSVLLNSLSSRKHPYDYKRRCLKI